MRIWIAKYNHLNYKTQLGVRAATFQEAYKMALKHVRPAASDPQYKLAELVGLYAEMEAA